MVSSAAPPTLLLATLACLSAGSVSKPAVAAPAPGRLHVSENHRYLVDDHGRPFFWLGDTAWELFHRLNREQADRYLQDRAAKGFTVVQAVVLAELEGLTEPNAYGDLPLENKDPSRPNEAYFAHVDWVISRANALGLVVGLLPTWGDKWNKKWGTGPEIFDPKNAEAYGQWLGERYKDAALVWIVGGDRPVETDGHREIVRAMARGLRAGDGGRHLITLHPMGGGSSADWFHDDEWLDFNMRQNGHVSEFGRYAKTYSDYSRTPVKPVIDGEPIYEDHPVSFKADEFGISVAADVRRALYWDLFGGAFGHTYGHHSVWQMWSHERKPINNPLMTWEEALAQPGAGQMQYGRWLMESRPFLTRVPDDSIIVSDRVSTAVPGAGRYRYVATRATEGRYAMVYAPAGRPFTVRMNAVKAKKVRAWWFDPRTGKAQMAGTFAASGDKRFTPTSPGEHLDWVLVLDDATARFAAPGSRQRSP